MELIDREICYRALQSRDPRFDGLLFVGATSTGIYCRPVCPARTPQLRYCRFFNSAVAAHAAGFRPCLRCRPESAPDVASSSGMPRVLSKALALIADGAMDGDDESMARLSGRLGVGDRQLRRLFLDHLGASPREVVQTRRVLFAKQLLHETRLPMAQVAFAAGFGSVRRFNEVFRDLFHRPPSALRRESLGGFRTADAAVTLRLRYRPPYDWPAMLAHLQERAIPGIECVEEASYQRTIEIDGTVGLVCVENWADEQSLGVTIRFPDVRALPAIVLRVRRLFDVDADIETIGAHLSRDSRLAPLVAARPGLRAPGGWDGFELGVRAVLGQQVSIAAARRLAGQLVAYHGTQIPVADRAHPLLSHSFPTAETVAVASLGGLGVPLARQAAVKALAENAAADPDLFRPAGTIDEAIARFRSIRGVDEWTAQYIAVRALRETDAFPVTDAGVLRGARLIDGGATTPQRLLTRAERWRPWRAYAAQHLWAAQAFLRRESAA